MAFVKTISILFLSIFVPALFGVRGYITEENNFAVLKTRDAGTFVGIKEEVLGEVPKKSTTTSSLSKTYYAFRGIPYAKPPVGPLRWKEPEPPDLTAGPKDATKFKPNCPQWDSVQGKAIGNVDCLYLNIFTPRLSLNTGRGQGQQGAEKELSPYDEDPRHAVRWLPVLIYVHDGNFVSGSGDISNYQQFLDENTLLVTFNYRLGVFGFLVSPEASVVGNYGILDQILSLKWIRKNIHRFSGDPNRITIFGDVSPLLLSPLATPDLYQGVIIMESPTSMFSPGFMSLDRLQLYSKMAVATGCQEEKSHQEILDCFEISTVEDLIEAQTRILELNYIPGLIGPVVYNGSEVFPLDPQQVLESDEFLQRSVPVLLGVDAAEGFKPFHKFYKSYIQNLTELDEDELKASLRVTLIPIFPTVSSRAVEDIWEFYFPNFSSDASLEQNRDYVSQQMLKLFGDVSVYNGHWQLLQALAKREAVTFNYVFEQNLEKLGSYLESEKSVIGENETLPCEEKYFLFHQYGGKVTESDQDDTATSRQFDEFMGKTMVKIWTSFAAYRTPKNALAKEKSWGKWVRLSDPNDYFHLTPNGSMMKNGFRRKEAEFWKTTFSKVYPADIDTDVDKDNRSEEATNNPHGGIGSDATNNPHGGIGSESDNGDSGRSASSSPTIASLSMLMLATVIGSPVAFKECVNL